MKSRMIALVVLVLLTGCMSVQKANDIVTERYQYVKNVQPSQNFVISNAPAGGKVAQTQKIRSTAIPALFYWKFSKTYQTDIHSVVPLNLFSKYADDFARTNRLHEKIGQRKVELHVTSIPQSIESTFSNQTIYLLLAAATSYSNHAHLNPTDLKVDYKVFDGDQTVDAGTIEVTESDLQKYSSQLIVSKKAGSEPKTFLKNYLDLYENVIYLQSKVFVDKLMSKITPEAHAN